MGSVPGLRKELHVIGHHQSRKKGCAEMAPSCPLGQESRQDGAGRADRRWDVGHPLSQGLTVGRSTAALHTCTPDCVAHSYLPFKVLGCIPRPILMLSPLSNLSPLRGQGRYGTHCASPTQGTKQGPSSASVPQEPSPMPRPLQAETRRLPRPLVDLARNCGELCPVDPPGCGWALAEVYLFSSCPRTTRHRAANSIFWFHLHDFPVICLSASHHPL